MSLDLRMAVAFLLATCTQFAAELPPVFSYRPNAVRPGESMTVEGRRFPVGSTYVALALVSPTGVRTTVAVAPVVAGSFSKTMTIPESFTPGPYFISVIDKTRTVAINLVGSVTVVPANAPFFRFAPTTVTPGGSVTIFASGFTTQTGTALIGITGTDGTNRILAGASISGGAFQRSITIPANLANNQSYRLVVRSLDLQLAAGLSGPLTVAAAPVSPTIRIGNYPIGATVHPGLDRIYVPNGADNTVSVIDGSANQVIATVPVGGLPCAIASDPGWNRIYVANVNTNDISVLDTMTNTIIATVPVGSMPCAVAVTPGNQRVFVGNYGSDDVTAIDAVTLSPLGTIPVPGPFGMAANAVTGRVYVASGFTNSLRVIDSFTLQQVAQVDVGADPDAVGVNELTNRVYVANYLSENLTVVDGTSNTVLATIRTGKEPSGVTANSTTNHIFVSNYASGTTTVIDGGSLSVIGTLAVGIVPDGAAVNPLTNRVYIINSISGTVSVITDMF